MATNTDIKAALSFPADETNPHCQDGRTVGNGVMGRVKAWHEATFAPKDAEGEPREMTADDLAALLEQHIEVQVGNYEDGLRTAANPEPAVAALDDGE